MPTGLYLKKMNDPMAGGVNRNNESMKGVETKIQNRRICKCFIYIYIYIYIHSYIQTHINT